MKPLFTVLFLIVFINGFSQERKFHIEGRVVDANQIAVSDAYILNFRDLEKNVTRQNGVFDMWALPGDSIIVSHIAYKRKIVTVFTLLVNPVIVLEPENIDITEIDISPDQKTDYEKAKENLVDVKDFDFPIFQKIDDEPKPVIEMVTEHNRVMRTEASAVSLVRI